MFKCERCGSGYSAMHAATLENCPRCHIRDKIAAPLAFKAFTLPDEFEEQRQDEEEEPGREESAHLTA